MAAAALVRLDHNYVIPFITTPPIPVELPPPHAPPRKAVKVVREEPPSRFKPIKYLLNRDENDESVLPPSPKASPSKLEHLLKRTSMYDGPGGYPQSPRHKLYNYYREEEYVGVDVVSLSPEPDLHCDLEKARVAMNECETHVNFARPTEVDDNWEEQIVKTGWTKLQRHLFHSVMKSLHSEHFARLAYEGNSAEVVLRRNSLDLTSYRVRKALANVCWDAKLTQWLHGVLIDNLSHHYLAMYLDVLQTLRGKAPALVDRMIVLSTVTPKTQSEASVPAVANPDKPPPDPNGSPKPQEGEELAKIINAEAVHLLIKRQWDPFSSVIHHKGIKLKCNPVFLFVPAGPSWGHTVNIRRHKHFVNMLSSLGKVITVTMAPEISLCSYLSVEELAEKMILSSKLKLNETKSQLPDRPIYLVGWGTGSIIASTVSLTEQVAGVVCLGFPIFGSSARHGEGSDPLLQMKHPVLFVIGDRATNCTISLLEEFREDLTNLQNSAYIVAIKSGDEYLRVSRHHRKRLLVTQSYVDKCIVDEIALFVNDSYDAKTSVQSMTTPLTTPNSLGEYGLGGEPLSKQSLNGEPMEGLGLSLALSNGHDQEEETNAKKNRRKSYHRKSLTIEDDLTLPELSGGQSPSSARLSPTRKYRTKNVKLEPGTSGGTSDGAGRYGYETSMAGLSQQLTNLQSFAHSSSYPGMSGGYFAGAAAASGLLGTYPYFPGPEASEAYSAAFAHVANQAAAIQHAIAMETVEGYNQYYSELEKYNSNSQLRQTDPMQKKPRKPRETKPKGDKPPRRPRQTKAEKAAEALASMATIRLNESNSSQGTAAESFLPTSSVQSSNYQQEAGHSAPKQPSTLLQLLGQTREAFPVRATEAVHPHLPSPVIPPPNTQLPPPSTTMAALAMLSSSPVPSYTQATSSSTSTLPSTPSAFSSSQVFAVKSLPPSTPGFLAGRITAEMSPNKTESAPRSPPLLIPTQKSPNRIPIRLCLQQTDPSGNGTNSTRESIEASLVPLPVEEPRDEISDLPLLVPIRIQSKVVPSEPKPGSSEPKPATLGAEEPKSRQRLRSGEMTKNLANEIAVEHAKNLQVKLPRISIPPKPVIPAETRPHSVPSPPVVVGVPEAPPKPSSSVPSSTVKLPLPSKPEDEIKDKVEDLERPSSSTKAPAVVNPTGDMVVEVNPKPKPQPDFESSSDDDIPIANLKARGESRKAISQLLDSSSSDEPSLPNKPKPGVEAEGEGQKTKGKNTSKKTVPSDEDEVPPSPKRAKRTIRAAKIAEARIYSSDEDEDEDDPPVAKKSGLKRSSKLESSSSSTSEGTSTNVRRGIRTRRSSKIDTSDDEMIPRKKGKRISKIDSSDEEIEPKVLRSRSATVKSTSGDEKGRTRRHSKRKTYVEEVDLTTTEEEEEEEEEGEEEEEEERRPIKNVVRRKTAETPKPTTPKRKTRQSGGGGGDDKWRAGTTGAPSKSVTDRRMTRGSDDKKRPAPTPEIPLVELVDSEATTEEDDDYGDDPGRRVTRSSGPPSRRPSRGEGHQQKSKKDNNQEESEELLEEDGEENGHDEGGNRRRRSIFPVTPASLAATRTRKVSIPKFFAYGM